METLDPLGLMLGGVFAVALAAVLFVISDDRVGDIGAAMLTVLGVAAVVVGAIVLIAT